MAGLANEDAKFAIGSPQFDTVTIRLNPDYYPGGSFVIEAKDNSRTNRYVQRFILDGQPLHTPEISFHKVVKGGRLEVQMGSEPKDEY